MAGYLIAWIIEGAVLLSLPVFATAIYLRRHPDRESRARFVRRAGMTFFASFAFLVTATLIGETLMDPGGWRATGLVAALAVPLVVLAGLAWTRPASLRTPLSVMTWLAALVVGIAGADQRVADLEDRIGPVAVIILFFVMVPVAALGHSDPRSAGWMLLALAVVPTLIVLIVAPEAGRTAALVIFAAPMSVTAALYLVAGHMMDRTRRLPSGRLTPQRGHRHAA